MHIRSVYTSRRLQNRSQKKQHSGFTLIELLVVIAIIGTLASVVLASLGSARERARDSARAAQMGEVQTALELYYTDNSEYPSPGSSPYYLRDVTGLAPTYIGSLPSDPSFAGQGKDYRYYTNNTSAGYTLLRSVESDDDATWCRIVSGGMGGFGNHPLCNEL